MTASDAPTGAPGPLRIAVIAHGDPESPSTWSGTPAGIIAGLREAGHHVVGISAAARPSREKRVLQLLALPGLAAQLRSGQGWRTALTHAVSRARNTRLYRRWSTLLASRRLRARGPQDLVVRIGSAFGIEHPCTITVDDLTIAQVLARDSPDWRGLPAATIRSRLAAQRRGYEAARAVALATPWAARSVREDLRIEGDSVVAVGVGIPHLTPPPPRDWSRPRYLFIGKNWEQKGGPALLEAFARLRARIPAARLDLVGHHPPVSAPGVTGHGFLDLADPAARARRDALYSSATCLVVPTPFEAAGIVFLEAAAAGIPSIGAAGCGAADIIGPGGLVAAPGDPAALAAAMEQLADPARAAELGAAGHARVPLFTWSRVAGRLVQAAGLQEYREQDWDGLFDAPAREV